MKNKLAIFDMDGTLFDTSEANFKSYQKALKEYNYELDYDYFINSCFGKHYKKFLIDIANFSLKDLEKIHENKKKYYKEYLAFIKENKKLFNLLEIIRSQYYIALVTTASKDNTYEILEYFNKKDLFDLILTQNDIKNFKPSQDGFNKAMEYFNITKENTIIFEDSDVGIEAARRSGATLFIVDK